MHSTIPTTATSSTLATFQQRPSASRAETHVLWLCLWLLQPPDDTATSVRKRSRSPPRGTSRGNGEEHSSAERFTVLDAQLRSGLERLSSRKERGSLESGTRERTLRTHARRSTVHSMRLKVKPNRYYAQDTLPHLTRQEAKSRLEPPSTQGINHQPSQPRPVPPSPTSSNSFRCMSSFAGVSAVAHPAQNTSKSLPCLPHFNVAVLRTRGATCPPYPGRPPYPRLPQTSRLPTLRRHNA